MTYFVYENVKVVLETAGEHFAHEMFSTQKLAILNFFGGSLVLLISGMVFAPIYLFLANIWGVIEDDEKESVLTAVRRIWPRRGVVPVADGEG